VRSSRHSFKLQVVPTDLTDPGDDFLRQEIDQNRRSERWVVAKALVAIAFVVGLVIIREVVFL
jgi:hypothetical protein